MIVGTVRTPIPLSDLPGVVAGGYAATFGCDPCDACRRSSHGCGG